jgi:hypothetical protein
VNEGIERVVGERKQPRRRSDSTPRPQLFVLRSARSNHKPFRGQVRNHYFASRFPREIQPGPATTGAHIEQSGPGAKVEPAAKVIRLSDGGEPIRSPRLPDHLPFDLTDEIYGGARSVSFGEIGAGGLLIFARCHR